MSANINSMEVVILNDRMPRSLTILVKVPGQVPKQITAHWDVAASQFTPLVMTGLNQLVEGIINRHGVRRRGPASSTTTPTT